MGKIKIHEIAKEVGLTSKEVIQIANDLGIGVTSHLSAVDDNQAAKIRENIKPQGNGKKVEKETADSNKKKQAENTKKSDSSNQATKKEATSNAKKSETPVIIRREVIISEEEEKEKELNKNRENRKKDVGFVERTNKNDYNIVYRNKQTKPLTVSELFGIKPKNEPAKVEQEKIETENVLDTQKTNPQSSVKKVESTTEIVKESAEESKISSENRVEPKNLEEQKGSSNNNNTKNIVNNNSDYNNQQRNVRGNTQGQYEKSKRREKQL